MGDYTFNPDLACKIGVDEAIMVSNLVFWIRKNIANQKHFHDGRYWTYNSVEAFKDLFPFWTAKQLRRVMESLYEKEVIIKGNYNKLPFDRTGWYAIGDKYLYLLGTFDLPKRANAEPERANGNAEKGEAIPDSKTDSKQSLSNDKDLNENDLFSSANVEPPAEKKEKSSAKKERKSEVLMRDAPELDLEYFKAKVGEKYHVADLEYYHECALAWSDKDGNKAKDWTATIRGFILRDRKDGTLVLAGAGTDQKINGVKDTLDNWDDI